MSVAIPLHLARLVVLGIVLTAGIPEVSRAAPLPFPVASADPAREAQVRRDLEGDDLKGRDGPFAKVGADLTRLFREHEAFRRSGALGVFHAGQPGLPVLGEFVVIDAASDDPRALRAGLEALGLRNAVSYQRIVSGRLPIAAIERAAALPSLRLARPAAFQTHIGSVTSQGDSAMETSAFRVAQSVDGTGVTIGTLSDSYDCAMSSGPEVASGDLPGAGNPNGYTTDVEVLDDDACGGDEGRAMMQLIHDVAPGAAQSFHTATLGQASFALGIEELAGCPPGSDPGCIPATNPADILVDDVSYFAAPMFQDGIVAQAVDRVVGAGVIYFSAAANSGRDTYESPFVDSGITMDIGAGPQRAHDFDPGPGVDIYQKITIPRLTVVTFSFQWDQPFFSVSGGSGSLSDYDFVLMNDPPTTVLKSSADPNVGGDPVEVMAYAHLQTNTTFNVVLLEHDPGLTQPDAGLMKWVAFNHAKPLEYLTDGGTVYGQSNSAGAEAVGAAFFPDTPAFGTTPPVIEDFSSAGGTPILFSTSGTSLGSPIVREKPGIVAPDGTNTTFFGFDVPEDPDTDPNFSGTSAAAPHAAAYAALLLESNPGFTPSTLVDHLRSTAIDMDDPWTGGFDFGFDYGTGYGLVKASAPTVSAPPSIPADRLRASNSPNPFVGATTLRFSIPAASEIELTVFDLHGRRVRSLASGTFAPGSHEKTWDGRNDLGRAVPSGIYFARLEAGDRVATCRMARVH